MQNRNNNFALEFFKYQICDPLFSCRINATFHQLAIALDATLG